MGALLLDTMLLRLARPQPHKPRDSSSDQRAKTARVPQHCTCCRYGVKEKHLRVKVKVFCGGGETDLLQEEGRNEGP